MSRKKSIRDPGFLREVIMVSCTVIPNLENQNKILFGILFKIQIFAPMPRPNELES